MYKRYFNDIKKKKKKKRLIVRRIKKFKLGKIRNMCPFSQYVNANKSNQTILK